MDDGVTDSIDVELRELAMNPVVSAAVTAGYEAVKWKWPPSAVAWARDF